MAPVRSSFRASWHFVARAGNGLVSALLAPACAACDAVLDEPLRDCVCENCWAAVRLITPPMCDRCGDPLARPSPFAPSLCPRCCTDATAVDRWRAAGEYDGALRDIVHALKYRGRRSLARPLATLMRSRGAGLLDNADGLVPVPLHWRRECQRGFNQARDLAHFLGPPVLEALVRARPTRPQVELAADVRRRNVAAAFGPRRGFLRTAPSVEGLALLLVDDVSTTGATLEACARVLKEAGASEVCALTAARVVIRTPPDKL